MFNFIVSRNMQIKTTVRNLNCWNGNSIKSDYISNVDGDVEDPELSYTAGGTVESYKHPGKQFCSFLTFYQKRYTCRMIQPFHSRCLSRINACICLYKDLYMNVQQLHCNSPKLEITQCPSAGEWINTLWYE